MDNLEDNEAGATHPQEGSEAELETVGASVEEEPAPMSVEDIVQDLSPENVELFHSILELAQNPQGDRTRLYTALAGATFLVPLAKEPETPENATEPTEVNLEVLTLTGPNGELALPVFTHEAALRLWSSEPVPTIPLPGGAVFQLSAGAPMQVVAINPAGPFGGQVTRAEFEPLAQGMLPNMTPPPQAPEGAQNVYIDIPMVPVPQETVDRLTSLMESNPAIKSAHLFLMQMGDATSPQLTLGISAEGPASQWVEPQVTRMLQQEKLNFDPYAVPTLLLLNAVPGAGTIRETVPAFFRREEDEMDEATNSEDEEEPGMMDEEEAEEPTRGRSAPEDSGDTPKKRSRWPFGRR